MFHFVFASHLADDMKILYIRLIYSSKYLWAWKLCFYRQRTSFANWIFKAHFGSDFRIHSCIHWSRRFMIPFFSLIKRKELNFEKKWKWEEILPENIHYTLKSCGGFLRLSRKSMTSSKCEILKHWEVLRIKEEQLIYISLALMNELRN